MPAVNRWWRLEPQTRSAGLESGLSAEIRDPLWMLARQWQLGEFQGEDAATPVQVRLRVDCTPLTRYLPAGLPAAWYAGAATVSPTAAGQRIGSGVPLEAVVERERVREGMTALRPRAAAEAGLHFLRLLSDGGAAAQRAAVIGAFALPSPDAAASLDSDTRRFLTVMAGRVPDGVLLATVQRVLATPTALDAIPEPHRARVAAGVHRWQTWTGALAPADRDLVTATTRAWLSWYDALFSQPAGPGDASWIPQRLEYEFAVSAPTPQQEVLLTAPEYADGHLDWYSFDTLATGSLGAARGDLTAQDVEREAVRRTVLPTPLAYPGMPASRYWEFEDARVDFGAITVQAQQLAHLLLVDFALVSGDDWFIIPVDMAVGSVATVRWLVVTDSFGDRTVVPSARQVDRAGAQTPVDWDMFSLSPDVRPLPGPARPVPELFLLPPALGTSLHGGTTEEVLLLRDEMANMAWAVERLVENPLGRPFDRTEAFQRSRQQAEPAVGPPSTNGAAPVMTYRLETETPDHWLPLYPTRVRADAPPIQLLRGGTPQGRLLEPPRDAANNPLPLLISEEEVPRAGARVTRAFQYARWIDGSTHLWVGRRKTPGRGEGSSGKQFDVLEPHRT